MMMVTTGFSTVQGHITERKQEYLSMSRKPPWLKLDIFHGFIVTKQGLVHDRVYDPVNVNGHHGQRSLIC